MTVHSSHASWFEPEWTIPAHVRAICTTRNGGCSEAPFDSFNLANHVGDSEDKVRLNREKFRQQFGLHNPPVFLRQIHSNRIVTLENTTPTNTEADASMTRCPAQVCVILVADCIPLLLCDEAGCQVAAVHAGWRGLASGIVPAAVAAFDMRAAKLSAWIGPHISDQHYEVGDDLIARLANEDPEIRNFVVQGVSSRRLNLGAWCENQLRQCGVTQIWRSSHCVYAQDDLFFSHRRSGKTGRFAAAIWISQNLGASSA